MLQTFFSLPKMKQWRWLWCDAICSVDVAPPSAGKLTDWAAQRQCSRRVQDAELWKHSESNTPLLFSI